MVESSLTGNLRVAAQRAMLSHASKKHSGLLSYLCPACLFLLLIVLVMTTGTSAAAPATGGIEITTDKYIYQPGETVSLDIRLDPGGRELAGDLVLAIYPAGTPLNPDSFSREPLKEISVEEGLQLTGVADFQSSVDLGDLPAERGGFPVKVSLRQDGAEVLGGVSWLAVIDAEAGEPLDLVLLWTAGSPPLRNAQGEFFSGELLERCRATGPSGDSLLQHQAIQARFPGMKTTYAIEPALLDQLFDMADGFTIREGDRLVSYAPDSAEAVTAAVCLESLKSLAASGNAEMLGAPYAFGSLPLLARQGWDDGSGQYRIGHDVTTRMLGLVEVPRGAYVPGLDLTTDSLRYVAGTGGEYAVLAGGIRADVQGRNLAGRASYRLRDIEGNRVTAFFADDAMSLSLLGDQPDLPAFFASLANAHASGEPVRLAIAAAPVPDPALAAGLRESVYAELDGQPWVRTLTLAEAKQKYPPDTEPATLLRYYDPASGYLEQAYYRRLAEVHELYEDYRVAVDADEPEVQRLERKMYMAEGYWLAGENISPEAANLGLEYLDAVSAFATEQFAGLSVRLETPKLQRRHDSEFTVVITNNNPYPFNVELVVEGEGLQVGGERSRPLRLQTGDTRVTFSYHVDGWTDVRAEVRSRGHVIMADDGAIRPVSGRMWIVIGVTAAAAVAGGIYIHMVRRRRA